MIRFVMSIVAGLAIFASGSALAGPGEQTCARGVGMSVCCVHHTKACGAYTACCEKGNAGFFTASHCAKCAARTAAACDSSAKAKKGSACASRGAACAGMTACSRDGETGNAAFFTSTRACASHRSAAAPACCSGDAKK